MLSNSSCDSNDITHGPSNHSRHYTLKMKKKHNFKIMSIYTVS